MITVTYRLEMYFKLNSKKENNNLDLRSCFRMSNKSCFFFHFFESLCCNSPADIDNTFILHELSCRASPKVTFLFCTCKLIYYGWWLQNIKLFLHQKIVSLSCQINLHFVQRSMQETKKNIFSFFSLLVVS